MKPRIGIMTFYAVQNYGAALQAYALQHKLSLMGAEAILMRYFDMHNEHQADIKNGGSKIGLLFKNKTLIKNIIRHPAGFIKARKYSHMNADAFSSFRRSYMNTSIEPYYDFEDLESANFYYNGFVAGSDMVWTPIGQNLKAYFLQFADREKRFSYSPSMTGCSSFSKEDSLRIQSFLSDFNLISCREREGCDYVKKCTGRGAEHTLDPTILLTAKEWRDALNLKKKNVAKPYILCYCFGGLPSFMKKEVSRIAKERDMDVIYIPLSVDEILSNVKNGLNIGCGPKEFVELYMNASFCISNGFHGLLFSLLFEKPFVVIHREKDNKWKSNETRISDFLNKLKIANRYIDPNQSITNDLLSLDYVPINIILNEERIKSQSYLNSIVDYAISNSLRAPVAIKNVRDLSPKKCSGCELCLNICPFDAISFREDEEGFKYPIINNDKCRECGKCAKHCPCIRLPRQKYPQESVMCISKHDLVENSASGGAFITLAKYYIEVLEGVVYGVVLDKDFRCRHTEATTMDGVKPMQNSKYIQSEVGKCYEMAKDRLDKGTYVLFTGTPCQIAALCSYLGKEYDNLLTMEVVCHGVPNQMFWDKYIKHKAKEGNITSFTFRNRSNRKLGRSTLEGTIVVDNKSKRIPWTGDPYYGPFVRNESFRKSCYYCQYARPERVADITVADCDSEKFYPDFFPKESKSVLLVNTEKGKRMWNTINSNFEYRSLDYKKEIEMNTCLGHPSEMPRVRKYIYKDLAFLKWDDFVKKYTEKQTVLIKLILTAKRF